MTPTAEIAISRPPTPIQPSASTQLAAPIQPLVQTQTPILSQPSTSTQPLITVQPSVRTPARSSDGFMPPPGLLEEDEEREFNRVIWMLYGHVARELEFKLWAQLGGSSHSSSALLINRDSHVVYKGGYQHGEPGPERDAKAIRVLLSALQRELDAPDDRDGFPNRYTRSF